MLNFFKNIFKHRDKGIKVNYTSKEIEILKEQLDNLLDLSNEDGIAISFQGSWGIGKTFFWNYYITHKLGETKFVNISLFGINSLEDIKKQIVLKIYDRNKISNFLDNNPIVGKFIESKWGIDAALIASNFKKDDFKNIVVCFDDFERISSNLSLSEILGFISELKEQHSCKVVLINNNNMLKIQDELNHKKHIRKNKDGDLIERYFTTQTNNQEIFDKYTEKIIDVTLKYEPHLKDNIRFLKEKNIHKTYIDWELLENLFSTITDNNKKLNIRLMKQIVIKLDLLQDILILNEIDKRIKNGILVELFKGIINQKVDLSYLNIEIKIPFTLQKTFEKIINKHSLDLDFFQDEIKKFNSSMLQQEDKDNLYQSIQDKYFDYLYNLTYEKSDFVNDFYKLLNTDDVDIVKLVGLSNFEFYITEFLKKLDSDNEEKYNILFIKKAKFYIEKNINTLENLDMFTKKGVDRVLEDYQELLEYYTFLKNKAVDEIIKSPTEIKDVMSKLLSDRNGYSKKTEELLSNIDSLHHKKWMIEDREYFELIFNLMNWITGFSGDKPFGDTYENILIIYVELSQDEKYEHKMKFILDRYPLTSKAIYKMFLNISRENREKLLRDTAKVWASKKSKKYNESTFTPINEFHSGFSYYLLNVKQGNYYKSIEIAMEDYFNDSTSSGPNFFE